MEHLRVAIAKKGYEVLGKICNYMPRYLQEQLSFLYMRYYEPVILGYTTYLKVYGFLRQSQWWTCQRLESYQNNQLKQLLKYTYMNVPYYTDLFRKLHLSPGDINSIEDLRKLPILTREDVVRNFDKLVVRRIKKKHMVLVTTSGTTGTPMQFYLDKHYTLLRIAFIRRSFDVMNIKWINKHIYLWSKPFLKKDATGFYLYEPLIKRLSLSTLPYEDTILEKYLFLIKQYKPHYVEGNPSALYQLACYAQENGINDTAFSFFVSYFENIFPYQRDLIKKQFKCEIFNCYITEERVVSAVECPNHEGMHIDMERGICEIVGENGDKVRIGQQGRIIATGLHNYVMPLIRYEVGDIASISETHCPCGRGSRLLKSLEGRSNEIIKCRGKIIYSTALSVIIWKFKFIKECQFIQESDDEITVNIVKRDGDTNNNAQEFIRILKEMIDDELKVVLHFVDSIPRTKTGKFPFVISKLNSTGKHSLN